MNDMTVEQLERRIKEDVTELVRMLRREENARAVLVAENSSLKEQVRQLRACPTGSCEE